MKAFIDAHREVHGVEPIYRVLPIAPSANYAYAARKRDPTRRSACAQLDAGLMPELQRVWMENFRLYGVRKGWRQLCREQVVVASCTVARLMRLAGLRGMVRVRTVRATVGPPNTPCPRDHVQRQFRADRPNQLLVSDFTCVSTYQGFASVAFFIDV